MNDFRQNSMRLLARIDQAIAEAELLLAEMPMDGDWHMETAAILAEFRAVRERLEKLLNSELSG